MVITDISGAHLPSLGPITYCQNLENHVDTFDKISGVGDDRSAALLPAEDRLRAMSKASSGRCGVSRNHFPAALRCPSGRCRDCREPPFEIRKVPLEKRCLDHERRVTFEERFDELTLEREKVVLACAKSWILVAQISFHSARGYSAG